MLCSCENTTTTHHRLSVFAILTLIPICCILKVVAAINFFAQIPPSINALVKPDPESLLNPNCPDRRYIPSPA